MNAFVSDNFKSLKIYYIVHIVLYILEIIFNFVLLAKIIWLKDLLYKLFFFGNIFSFLYFIIPFIPLIFILLKKLTKKNIKLFKALTAFFCSVSIILGIFFSGILMVNAIGTQDYYRECPFNIEISTLSPEFNIYFNKDISNENDNGLKNKCLNRRCALNSENENNQFTYEYICNYDPTNDFEDFSGPFKKEVDNNEIIADHEIICSKIELDNFNFEKEIIYKYYDICNNFVDFFICGRFDRPMKFDMKKNIVCPNESYIKKLIMFSILNVFANLIIGNFPWILEYCKYNEIIAYYYSNNTNEKSNSLNSTKNSSKIEKENIKEKTLERAPTETIIVYRERKKNIINNIVNENNYINNMQINKIEINTINNNTINNNRQKNEEINIIKIYTNTEENTLKNTKIENDKREYFSKEIFPSERIIIADNQKK